MKKHLDPMENFEEYINQPFNLLSCEASFIELHEQNWDDDLAFQSDELEFSFKPDLGPILTMYISVWKYRDGTVDFGPHCSFSNGLSDVVNYKGQPLEVLGDEDFGFKYGDFFGAECGELVDMPRCIRNLVVSKLRRLPVRVVYRRNYLEI